MTIQQIIDAAEAQYPRVGTWTDANIVAFLNREQREIFRELQTKTKYTTVSEKDTALYALPSDMELEFIESVLVSHDTYLTAQTGTVSVSGTSVTGSGTNFTSGLIGQYIVVNDETKIVATVSSTTSLTVTVAFDTATSDKTMYLYESPAADEKFVEYSYIEYANYLKDYKLTNQWYYDLNGNMGLYPIPSECGKAITIIYYPRPDDMSASTLTAEPELYEDYQHLLIYALIIEVASSGQVQDTDVANVYTFKYNELLKNAKSTKQTRRSNQFNRVKTYSRPYRNSTYIRRNTVANYIPTELE